ncbi:dTDP-4-dehydrorhamnose reductase [Thermogutta terrifontis]|uniref:dTDP-4-dehydrorhamnose reductase n=1 Tax=Thermogutta terrifontis TaxID=1331910 RepID=A0A286RE64_9BACT|nr:dTDP-4-dehydrorhamnose reductase [Thermogutta terrifontis]ASV74250.1 dTDP-4-dehydrorhamnose reductase [Thermogutta terrifontis]
MIAVTGAKGQLGGELCRQWGSEAVGLDLPEFDLLDFDGVRRTLRELRPHAIVHAAAYTAVDKAEEEPDRCFAINATATGVLAELARELNCPLLYVSTDYVFGGEPFRTEPFREEDPASPQGVYATSKYEGELKVLAWEKHYIVRTCGLYGRLGANSPGNFVETMIRLGRSGKSLRVVDDQFCTPSYVVHVARAIRYLLGTSMFGTFHIVNDGFTTWYRFACEIFRLLNWDVEISPITTEEYGAKAPRPRFSVLDTSKYQRFVDAPPLPHWKDALAEYLQEREKLYPRNKVAG